MKSSVCVMSSVVSETSPNPQGISSNNKTNSPLITRGSWAFPCLLHSQQEMNINAYIYASFYLQIDLETTRDFRRIAFAFHDSPLAPFHECHSDLFQFARRLASITSMELPAKDHSSRFVSPRPKKSNIARDDHSQCQDLCTDGGEVGGLFRFFLRERPGSEGLLVLLAWI